MVPNTSAAPTIAELQATNAQLISDIARLRAEHRVAELNSTHAHWSELMATNKRLVLQEGENIKLLKRIAALETEKTHALPDLTALRQALKAALDEVDKAIAPKLLVNPEQVETATNTTSTTTAADEKKQHVPPQSERITSMEKQLKDMRELLKLFLEKAVN